MWRSVAVLWVGWQLPDKAVGIGPASRHGPVPAHFRRQAKLCKLCAFCSPTNDAGLA